MGQYHKAVYFEDYSPKGGDKNSFSIAFNEDEHELFQKVAQMSSYAIKSTIGFYNYRDLQVAANKEGRSVNQFVKRLLTSCESKDVGAFQKKNVTFQNSHFIPFQRWYPYIEGYSPDFVLGIIDRYCPDVKQVYEPFAGTGTTIFACDSRGIKTLYSEVNPLLTFLIEAKCDVLKMSKMRRLELSHDLEGVANSLFENLGGFQCNKALSISYKTVFGNSIYFPDKTYGQLLRLREFIDNSNHSLIFKKLLTVAVLACLIPVSYLKKQGDLRFKTAEEKAREMQTLETILPDKIREIAEDVQSYSVRLHTSQKLIVNNAKNIGAVKTRTKASAVITSPPYLNGTNYFRNTKLELWFLGFLQSENDLRMFRDQALTSGINDVICKNEQCDTYGSSQLFNSMIIELAKKAYDKRIPIMAKCYFKEMEQTFNGIKNILEPNSSVLIDLGDSIFCGVHIPTDLILTEVLEKIGYTFKERILLRQRRSRNGGLLSQVLLVFQYKGEE